MAAAAAALALACVAATPGATAQDVVPPGENPCVGPEAKQLLCPDLRMAPPREMYAHKTPRVLMLHATNDIRSRGEGPLEVRGRRTSKRQMSVRQAIHTRGGKIRQFDTDARLVFYNIPGQGPYWKFASAAAFQLWSLDRSGKRAELVRKGPKLIYCFRDLKRTRPSKAGPRKRVYPACSQNPRAKKRRLGTSVGWSDIYPASYYQNWINVRGLRGCFEFVHVADPRNSLYENNESNNEGSRRIQLPPKGHRVRGC